MCILAALEVAGFPSFLSPLKYALKAARERKRYEGHPRCHPSEATSLLPQSEFQKYGNILKLSIGLTFSTCSTSCSSANIYYHIMIISLFSHSNPVIPQMKQLFLPQNTSCTDRYLPRCFQRSSTTCIPVECPHS